MIISTLSAFSRRIWWLHKMWWMTLLFMIVDHIHRLLLWLSRSRIGGIDNIRWLSLIRCIDNWYYWCCYTCRLAIIIGHLWSQSKPITEIYSGSANARTTAAENKQDETDYAAYNCDKSTVINDWQDTLLSLTIDRNMDCNNHNRQIVADIDNAVVDIRYRLLLLNIVWQENNKLQ